MYAVGRTLVPSSAVRRGALHRRTPPRTSRRPTRAVVTHASADMKTVPLHIGFVGTGLIGKVTVKQVGAHAPALLADSGLDLRIAACADSKHMILAAGSDGMEHKAIDAAIGDRAVADWDVAALNADAPTAADLDALVAKLKTNAANTGGAAVVVDNTSSEFVAGKYGDWLGAGVHVVTPNKKANSGDLARFKNFTKAAADGDAHWFYEGTIGAGLPVVSTLRTLRASGDAVRSVQGIFSGTMSFLFNSWDASGGQPFSEVVLAAKAAGYTEPDPRDDLNGLDVARKVVIAARESGVDLALDDVDVQSLVPAELEDCDADTYVKRLPEFDSVIAAQAAEAEAEGKVLRFVGKVDAVKGTGTVELAKFDKSHPFAGLQGADNILEIQSMRYSDEMSSTPLIIRGPGAGAQVTAGGVFGDLCKLGAVLGARVPV